MLARVTDRPFYSCLFLELFEFSSSGSQYFLYLAEQAPVDSLPHPPPIRESRLDKLGEVSAYGQIQQERPYRIDIKTFRDHILFQINSFI